LLRASEAYIRTNPLLSISDILAHSTSPTVYSYTHDIPRWYVVQLQF
jgi:hypothetical protein